MLYCALRRVRRSGNGEESAEVVGRKKSLFRSTRSRLRNGRAR